jgi:anti-sigma regulatory factor (Ser/Thr protein kinase)
VTATNTHFTHGALLYDGLSGFLAGTLPFLTEAVGAGEPALVAVEPQKAAALRAALPEANGAVRYIDMTDIGRNPGRIISAWADFLTEHDTAPRLRGVGEPVWPGRDVDEIDECQRHEVLLNVAFADRPGFTLMCPYDRSQLEVPVLAGALASHPLLLDDDRAVPSRGYDGRVAPFAGTLPEPHGDAEWIDLDEHSLGDVRRHVTAAAHAAGLDAERASDLALAVTEAVTNSLRHADGNGELRLWRHAGRVVCEVRDSGRIRDPLAGRLPVPLEEPTGRGLWLINQLCDLVQIRSSAAGNVVRMHMDRG